MLQQIVRLGAEGAFTPEQITILVTAFDSAWTIVQSSGAPFAGDDYKERGRNLIAKAIVDAALLGEFNQRTLTDDALIVLSKANLRRSRPHT